MKTQKTVLDAIHTLIPATVGDVFKYTTPDDYKSDKFTVVNTLGVPADPVQTVIVNVNCYAKDLNPGRGIPDLQTIDTMALAVIGQLHDYNNDVFDIEFEMMNVIREQALQMHFVNLRFRLIFINN